MVRAESKADKNSRPDGFGSASVLSLLLCLVVIPACGEEPAKQKNIVLVTLDTLRRDHVGAYGSQLGLTPNLDEVAAGGLVHDAAFTTMPTTSPAHASLMTGLEPYQHGVRRNGTPLSAAWRELELATLLRREGYATGAFVSAAVLELEVSGFGGFEHYDDPPHGQELREGREVVDAALHWLDEECCERPVFLWVHIFDPHSPYGNAQDKRRGLPVDPGIYGFVDEKRLGVAERERMNSLYAKGVREADNILRKLLDGLSKRLHEPLLAIVSDHGEALDEHLHSRGYAYDHGEYLDDEQIRIPLVLAGPGVERGRSPSAASIRDLYTTILEASGIGDPAAQERGRRDLRLSSPEPRIVAVERRVVFSNEFPRSRAGATDTMNQHAIAISDGHHTVLVGADGSISPAHLATEALGTAGKRRWSEIIKLARFSPHHLDDATRKALEALGYTTPESP